jgi:hypothetical protein
MALIISKISFKPYGRRFLAIMDERHGVHYINLRDYKECIQYTILCESKTQAERLYNWSDEDWENDLKSM